MRNSIVFIIAGILVLAGFPFTSHAMFGEDLEKPKPEFTQSGETVSAKLVPRAKSISVHIDFDVKGGKLVSVKGFDFYEAKRPEVDVKDFRSALFMIEIEDVAPGGESQVLITSDFFASGTQFWIFNEHLESPWLNSGADNLVFKDRVRQMLVNVKDGGAFDSDGAEDGKIFLVGGPKDSFWGYALGTLFIRFFGIFIVLIILMIGMIVSGKIFKRMDEKTSKPKEPAAPPSDVQTSPETLEESQIDSEIAAVIGLALNLHFSGRESSEIIRLDIPRLTGWTSQGRGQIMADRMSVFNR